MNIRKEKITAEQWRTLRQHHAVATDAVERRLHALHAYLSVSGAQYTSFRTPLRFHTYRTLLRDYRRLEAWQLFLQLMQRSARGLSLLLWVVSVLAPLLPRPRQRQEAHHNRLRQFSSHALVVRAYEALDDDLQGRWLTLSQLPEPNAWQVREVEAIERRKVALSALRYDDAPDPRQVALVCNVLALALWLRRCVLWSPRRRWARG